MNSSTATHIILAEIGAVITLGLIGLYFALLSDAVEDVLASISGFFYRLTLSNDSQAPTLMEKVEELRRTTEQLSPLA